MGAYLRKYGVAIVAGAYSIKVPIIKRAVVDFAVGADWTPAAGDVKVSKNGGTTANIATLPAAVAMGNTAYWEFVFADTELQCRSLMVMVADSATKAVEDQSFIVETYGNASAMTQDDPSDVVRMGLTALPNAAAEASGGLPTLSAAQGSGGVVQANSKQLGATVQTGRDVGLSVLLSSGTGTGQLDFTSGVVKSNLVQIVATALTETAGFLAAAFKKFFNVDTSVTGGNVNSLPNAAPAANGGLPTTNGTKINQTVDVASIATDAIDAAAVKADAVTKIQNGISTASALSTVDSNVTAIKNKTDSLAFTSGKVNAQTVAITADAIDAASVKADAVTKIQSGLATAVNLATVDTVVDAIQAKTDSLAFTAGKVNSQVKAIDMDAITADSVNADAVTKIQNGLATAANLATVDTVADGIKAKTDLLAFGTLSGFLKSDVEAVADITSKAANLEDAIQVSEGGDGFMKANVAAILMDEDKASGLSLAIDETNNVIKSDLERIKGSEDDATNFASAILSSGKMKSQVFGMEDDTITADAIETDAIDAAAVKADAVTKIQNGLATGANLQTVDDNVDSLVTDVAAVKVKTEQLTFDTHGDLNVDIDAIDGDLVDGNSDRLANTLKKALSNVVDQNAIRSVVSVIGNDVITLIQSGLATEANVDAVETKVDTVQATLDEGIEVVVTGTVDANVVQVGGSTDKGTQLAAAIRDDATNGGTIQSNIVRLEGTPADTNDKATVLHDALVRRGAGQAEIKANAQTVDDNFGAMQSIANALKLAPAVGTPAAGSVNEHLDSIATEVHSAAVEVTTVHGETTGIKAKTDKLGFDASNNVKADIESILTDSDKAEAFSDSINTSTGRLASDLKSVVGSDIEHSGGFLKVKDASGNAIASQTSIDAKLDTTRFIDSQTKLVTSRSAQGNPSQFRFGTGANEKIVNVDYSDVGGVEKVLSETVG